MADSIRLRFIRDTHNNLITLGRVSLYGTQTEQEVIFRNSGIMCLWPLEWCLYLIFYVYNGSMICFVIARHHIPYTLLLFSLSCVCSEMESVASDPLIEKRKPFLFRMRCLLFRCLDEIGDFKPYTPMRTASHFVWLEYRWRLVNLLSNVILWTFFCTNTYTQVKHTRTHLMQ